MEPKIRLKGFSGEWETSPIGETASLRSGVAFDFSKEYNRQYPCFGGNGIRGFVDEYSHEGCYPIIGRQGALCGNVTLAKGKFYATEHAVVASPKHNNVPEFLYYAYTKANLNQYATGCAQPGLAVGNINKVNILMPKTDEQKVLAAYFQHLDSLIQSTTKKIESLKQVKAASLQSMFPQEGETTPRVRFRGFEGEWEKKNFCEAFKFLKNNSLSRDFLRNGEGEIMNVHYGDVLIKYGDILDIQTEEVPFVIDNIIARRLYSACHLINGDIIIADAAEDNIVGKCSEIQNVNNQKVISGLHTIPCRTVIEVAPRYMGHYLNSNSFHDQLIPLIQGSKISSISKSVLALTDICLPTSIVEQKKIADFFTNLDKQITLQTQRLEKLKQIKSACLDNMFV